MHGPSHPSRDAVHRGTPSALVVLDMFTSFGLGSDRLLQRRTPATIASIAALIRRARAASRPVIFVHDRGDHWAATPAELIRAGSAQLPGNGLEAIAPLPGDALLLRAGPSAFDGSGLDKLLRARDIDHFALVGQIAEDGILRTALDGSSAGFSTTVPPDAVTAVEQRLADAALKILADQPGGRLTAAEHLQFTTRRQPRTPEPPRTTPGTELPAAAPRTTRTLLLSAFELVVAREGLSGAHLTAVASEARVSLRTFYGEFSSKHECLLELHRLRAAELEVAIRASVTPAVSWPDAIRRALRTSVKHLIASPRLSSAFLLELTTIGPDGVRAREAVMNRFAGVLVDLVDEARILHPHQRPRALPHLSARGMVGAVVELVTSHWFDPESLHADQLVDAAERMLIGVLREPLAEPVTP